MEKSFTSLSVTLAIAVGTLAPATGFAYLSPEQVFGGNNVNRVDTTGQIAPPTQREGDSVIQQQQERSAEQRQEAQKSLQPIDAPAQDTYVPQEKSAQSLNLFDQNAQYEKRQERMEESQGNGPTIIIGGNGAVIDSNGNVLHSGAPLITSTGPESVLALAAMILAAVSTVGYALYRSHRIAFLQHS